MSKQYVFLVRGSAPHPYEVTVEGRESNLTAVCTCPAGMMHQYCKHRFAILRGITAGIVSNNAEEVRCVVEMLKGTDVESALREVQLAEEQLATAKARLSALKKTLARVMAG